MGTGPRSWTDQADALLESAGSGAVAGADKLAGALTGLSGPVPMAIIPSVRRFVAGILADAVRTP